MASVASSSHDGNNGNANLAAAMADSLKIAANQEMSIDAKKAAVKQKNPNWDLKIIDGDGNCLFAAIADQLYGNPDFHPLIRKAAITYMGGHIDELNQKYENGIEDDGQSIQDYLANMSKNGKYGGQEEINAISKYYNINIDIYRAEGGVDQIMEYPEQENWPRVKVYYDAANLDRGHYDSIRDSTIKYPLLVHSDLLTQLFQKTVDLLKNRGASAVGPQPAVPGAPPPVPVDISGILSVPAAVPAVPAAPAAGPPAAVTGAPTVPP